MKALIREQQYFEHYTIAQHHYSARIDFDMHEFKLFLFSHALRYYHCV